MCLGWSTYRIMASVNRQNFTSSFLLWILFISFSCVIALSNHSSTMLIKSGESGILTLYQILKEKLSVLPHWLWCQLWAFHKLPLFCWGHFLVYLFCWDSLSWMDVVLSTTNGCLFCIYWDDGVDFIFHSVNVLYLTDWSVYVKPTLVCNFLMCCWILFVSILLRIFASMFNKDLALTYLSCSIFVWLWYQGDAGLMSLELIPLLLFFERIQEHLVLILLWMVELSLEAIWSWVFLPWEVLITTLISLFIIGQFRFSISSWFSLGRLYISRNLSISSRLANLHIIVYNCSLWSFLFLRNVL